MQYWVYLKKGDGYIHYNDYFLPGLVPDHVLELMIARTVDEKMGLCKNCPFDTHCHVIEEGTGRKYCPILFCDVVKPNWRVEQLL